MNVMLIMVAVNKFVAILLAHSCVNVIKDLNLLRTESLVQISMNVKLAMADVNINASIYMVDTDAIVQKVNAYIQTDEHV